MKSLREKAADLVRLATAPTAEPGERANAALAACRLIDRHGLLESDDFSHGAGAPPDLVQSDLVSVPTAGLCRACMRRIDAREPRHVIAGRGYQCQDCGPWSARDHSS